MKYDFMRSHASQFPLTGMCRVLSVSRNGYCDWCRPGSSARQSADLALAAHFRRFHAASRDACGEVAAYFAHF